MTKTLGVQGMRCAGCVSGIEKRLREVPGVIEASVNLATGQATVTHEPRTVSEADLIEAIRQAGYDAKPLDAEAHAEHARRHHHNHHANGASRELLIGCAVLGGIVFVLAMAQHTTTSAWAQLLFATPVQILLGLPFYKRTFRGLQHGRVNMDALVAIGTSVAYGYSLVVTLKGGRAVYFDTAVVILVLVGLGRLLESRAKGSAAAAIRSLMNLQPPEATVIRNSQQVTVRVDQVNPGDIVLVRPGQRVPVDGKVIKGQSTIDQAMFTGESLPVEVGPGDDVIGGTVNQVGAFEFKTTKTGKTTLLAQVIDLVEQAQGSKAQVQRIADAAAGVFVPAVLMLAVLTLLAWGLVGNWPHGISATVAVLIVACPCALGLATPTAIMVGTGLGASHGILIKDAAALERAGKLTHVILDKTGTLTVGRLAVKLVKPIDDSVDGDELLALAASVESHSEHPLAKAIVDHANQQGVEMHPVSDFKSMTASGVRGQVKGKTVLVGRVSTLREQDVEGADELLEQRDEMLDAHRTAVAVAVDGKAVGLISLADKLKPNAPQAVAALRELGLKPILMTGDHTTTARAIAQEVGIEPSDVIAEVLPADKQAKVAELQKKGYIVAMVGDGINDAPALAGADIGIAIGGGTDIAMEAGHVVLVGGDLAGLPRAIRLSRATMRRIYAGLFWAFAYNMLLIPVAAMGYLHPMFAAGAMSLSSVSVVLNALWLRRSWRP